MRTRPGPTARTGVAAAAMLLAATACGGSGDDPGAEPTGDDAAESTDAEAGSEDDGGGDGSASIATVTVDGASHEFPDVVECEIDGETWGEGWRRVLAWSADGHNLLDITVGNAESESLGAGSSVDIVIGTQHPNTLDEGNPDQEWTTLFGDGTPVAATLAPDGASGTASVGQASGGDPAPAEWSFAC